MSGSPAAGPIVLAGMHGSLVGEAGALLGQLGVPLVGAGGRGADDPWGIRGLHRQVLATSLGSEAGWLDGSTPTEIDRSALAGLERAALGAVAGAASAGFRGWAEPRSTLLLDWLDDRVRGSAYVLLYRPPWDVLASMEHTGVGPEVVLRTWMGWNRAILDFLDRHDDRCVLIEGGSILSDPMSVVTAVESLGFPLATGPSTRRRAASIWTAAARVADRRRIERRADAEPVHKLLDGMPVEARMLLGELDRRAAAVDTSAAPRLVDLVPERPGRPAAAAVVVTCRDDGWHLVDALASVRCCRADDVEALVVDRDSSDPRTIQTLDQLEAAGVSVVRISSSNRAEAWNTGMAATVAPLVVFLEPPGLLPAGFVTEAASRVAATPRLGMVRGDFARPGGDGTILALPPPVDQGGPGGGAVRREAARDVGGFDTDLGAAGLELFDLGFALVASGWEIAGVESVGIDCRTEGTAGVAQLGAAGTPWGQVIAKHRALLASSPEAATELLEAAYAAAGSANHERDRALAGVADAQAELSEMRRRHELDLAASNALAAAADARLAAMSRQARSLEERIAEVTDEVARRERAAEAARARASNEHALRLAATAEAEQEHREGARLAKEMAAIHATKLWRWSAAPRQVYRLLRRRPA